MTRRICVVTGTRAEYGLLKGVISRLASTPEVELQLIATGTHLAAEFGYTVREIEDDGFAIDERVEVPLGSDTWVGMSRATAGELIGLAEAYERLSPDLVLVLGDRFEILAAATAALFGNIPIAHIHGGESTEGAVDEAIRHAVTKMAHLHFVAAEPYRERVIQLGEHPDRVFTVGGLGIDAIRSLPLLEREELQEALGIELSERSLLVTFHPPTIEGQAAVEEQQALLEALDALGRDITLIFTLPNADAGGRALAAGVEAFCRERSNAVCFSSLGQLRYLSCLAQVSGVVGNSSSGLIEAPSFGIGTVNIGDRQAGRMRAASVIDCQPDRASIDRALKKLLSAEFQQVASTAVNPYGTGGASDAVVSTLATVPLEGLLKKRFFDLPHVRTSPFSAGK